MAAGHGSRRRAWRVAVAEQMFRVGKPAVAALPGKPARPRRAAPSAHRRAAATHRRRRPRGRAGDGAAEGFRAARAGDLRAGRAADGRHRPAGPRGRCRRGDRAAAAARLRGVVRAVEASRVQAGHRPAVRRAGRASRHAGQHRAAHAHPRTAAGVDGGHHRTDPAVRAAARPESLPVERRADEPPAAARGRQPVRTQPAPAAPARHRAAGGAHGRP